MKAAKHRSRQVASKARDSARAPQMKSSRSQRYWWAGGIILTSALLLGILQFANTRDRDRKRVPPAPATKSLATMSTEELAAFLKLPSSSSPESSPPFETEAWTAKLDETLQAFQADLANDAQAEHLHGLIDLKLKRTQLAEPHLRKAVALAPTDLQMKLDLADLLTQLGRDDEALTVLKAYGQMQLTPTYWSSLGDCQFRLGLLDDSAQSFMAALKTDASNAELWLKLAKTQLQQQKFVECEQSCRRAIELDAQKAEAWSLLGRALSVQKKTDEAKNALTRAGELTAAKPAQPIESFEVAHAQSMSKVIGSAFRSLAILYQAKGQPGKAQLMFRQAMQADPEDWLTLGKWAALMRAQGEFDQAALFHKQLVQRHPLEAAHYQNLANISMELNRPRDAEAALRLACLRRPEDGKCHLLLAKFLLLLNKPAEAVEPARTAVKLLDTEEARQTLQQAEQGPR